MSEGTLTGVSLGPGDPELITLKGLEKLRNADMILYPATDRNQHKSFSRKVLDQLDINTEKQPLLIPMTGKDRTFHYDRAWQQVKDEMQKGKHVAVVSEGDALFYSTFGYLLNRARQEGIHVDVVPGVPAFIAAGACGDMPIVDGQNGVEVMARPDSFEQLSRALEEPKTLVVMKMLVLDDWPAFLKQCRRPFLYVESLGTPEQFVATTAEELENRKIPYFSLIIFYPE